MTPEKRLADVDALLEEIDRTINTMRRLRGRFSLRNLIVCIKNAPRVDAVEVVHGRYEMGIDEGDYEYGTCSVCGYNEYNAFGCCLPHNYCPNCGAKMDGDGNG